MNAGLRGWTEGNNPHVGLMDWTGPPQLLLRHKEGQLRRIKHTHTHTETIKHAGTHTASP